VFAFNKIKMALMSDLKHDRMRVIVPIAETSKLTTEQKDLMHVLHRSVEVALQTRRNYFAS